MTQKFIKLTACVYIRTFLRALFCFFGGSKQDTMKLAC